MKIVVLASGRGSNFKAIMDHVRLGVLRNAEVLALIYSDPEARAAKVASEYGVPAIYVEHKRVPRTEREKRILDHLEDLGADLVVLAGYNYILSSEFVDRYRWRIINIHPSLLPFAGGKGMYGRRVHMEVYASGVRFTGTSVHFVDVAVDQGPVIEQEAVYIGDVYGLKIPYEDKISLIENRVLVHEHRLYSRVIQLLIDGMVELREERILVPVSVEVNGKVRFQEEERVVRVAVVNADEEWRREWRKRQYEYIKLQREEWRRMGMPLEDILGPMGDPQWS